MIKNNFMSFKWCLSLYPSSQTQPVHLEPLVKRFGLMVEKNNKGNINRLILDPFSTTFPNARRAMCRYPPSPILLLIAHQSSIICLHPCKGRTLITSKTCPKMSPKYILVFLLVVVLYTTASGQRLPPRRLPPRRPPPMEETAPGVALDGQHHPPKGYRPPHKPKPPMMEEEETTLDGYRPPRGYKPPPTHKPPMMEWAAILDDHPPKGYMPPMHKPPHKPHKPPMHKPPHKPPTSN